MKNSKSLKRAYTVLAEVYRRDMSLKKSSASAVEAYKKLKASRAEARAAKPGSPEQQVAQKRSERAVSVYSGRLDQNKDK